jgi:hypothetical protein
MDEASIESNFIEKGHSERIKNIYFELCRNTSSGDGQIEEEQLE